MKKSYLIALLLMTSTAMSATSPRVVAQIAKDCLPIPETVKAIVIGKDKAPLRTTAQKLDNPNSNIVMLAKLNESLEVFNHKPTFKDNYCWYEVKTPKERTKARQESLWVAQGNFLPFDSTGTPTPGSAVSPTNQPSQSPQLSPLLIPNPQKRPSQPSKQIDYLLLFLTIGLGAIGSVLGLVAVAYIIYKLREEITRLKIKIKDNQEEVRKIPLEVDNLRAKIRNLEHGKQTDKAQIGEIYKVLDNVQSEIQSLQLKINQQSKINAALVYSLLHLDNLKVIAKFNNEDIDYFNDPRFHPVKLSRESIQGKVSLDARRIIRFEQADSLSEFCLEFSADGENWLIPNIKSPKLDRILHHLSENLEIFIDNSGSGKSQLVKPAKLKFVSGGLWEIAEPGEFGDHYFNFSTDVLYLLKENDQQLNLQLQRTEGTLTQLAEQFSELQKNNNMIESKISKFPSPQKTEENYTKLAEQLSELQKKYNTLESKIPKYAPLKEPEENYIKLAQQLSELQKKYNTLESKIPESPPPHLSNSQPASSSQNKTSSTSQSIQNTVELSIMNYLKKNGNSTFYQLRLGIECEEQILRQSLIKLDKEDYINVEISPDHNVIYKVE